MSLRASVVVASLALACRSRTSSPLPAASVPIAWSPPVTVAVGPAVRGPWAMNASDYRWVDDPAVALAADGTLGVAWVDQAQRRAFFEARAPDGTRAAGPVAIASSPETFTWLPRVAWSEGGERRVYLAWQEIVFSGGSHGGEILFARSRDAGRSFSAPENLSRSPEGDGKGRLDADTWDNGSLALAASGRQDVFVAWTAYEGALWLRRSRDGGERFDGAVRLGGSHELPARAPSIAVDEVSGNVHVAWTVGEDPRANVRIATSRDRGVTFGPERVVARTAAHADAPSIACGARGVVHLAWAEGERRSRGGYRVVVTRSTDGAAKRFERARVISTDGEGASFPQVAAADDGRVVLTWERFVGRGAHPRGLGLAVSTDAGATFVAEAPLLTPAEGAWNGSQQGLLGQKLDARGRDVVVANSLFRPGARSEVLFLRGVLR